MGGSRTRTPKTRTRAASADARNDPTFLLAPVEIVATYELALGRCSRRPRGDHLSKKVGDRPVAAVSDRKFQPFFRDRPVADLNQLVLASWRAAGDDLDSEIRMHGEIALWMDVDDDTIRAGFRRESSFVVPLHPADVHAVRGANAAGGLAEAPRGSSRIPQGLRTF